MAKTKRDEIAYHEAGHVVVGRYLGLSIREVSVKPTGDRLGTTWTKATRRRAGVYQHIPQTESDRLTTFGELEAEARQKDELPRERNKMICLLVAGAVSAQTGLLFLEIDLRGDDWRMIGDILWEYAPTVRERLIDAQIVRARRILVRNWDQVERLVSALAKTDTLSAKEAAAICGGRGDDNTLPISTPAYRWKTSVRANKGRSAAP